MRDLKKRLFYENGFTIIEIIFIIILTAIIAAIAYPKFSSVEDLSLSSAFDKLKSDIYYAQELAMTTRKRSGIFIINAGSYRIYTNGDTSVAALDPAEFSAYEISLASTITIATTAAGSKIEFDNFGVPYDGNGALAAEQVITLSGSKTVRVTPQTGWVYQ